MKQRKILKTISIAWLLVICLVIGGCSIEIDRGDEETMTEDLPAEEVYLPDTPVEESSVDSTVLPAMSEGDSVLKELRIALVDQSSRQPWDVKDAWTAQCLMLLCDPLFEKGEDDSLIPVLAEGYSFGRDPESGNGFVTITLRSGIKFHDGSNFDAADVVYTINKLKNSDSYFSEKAKLVRRVEAVGTNSVRMYFDSVSMASLEALTFPIVPSSSVSAALPKGTGPYRWTKTVGKREYELGINQEWFQGTAQIETIRVYLVPDQETLEGCFETGRINLYTEEILEWGRYSNQINTGVHSFLTNEAVYIEFAKSGYCLSLDSRMAIAKAIDAQGVLRDSYYGRGYITETLLRPNTWYKPEADVAIGTEKMDKLEYTIELTLLYDSTDEVLSQAARSIQRQLQDLGYRVNLSENGSYYDIYLKRETFDLTSLLERQGIGVNGAMNYTPDMWIDLARQEADKEMESMDTYGLFFLQGGSITGYGIKGDLIPWAGHVFRGIENLSMGKEE